ncbi:MAG: dTMP kinase [Candidatus Omnitrophota bacterium]|jgi:dTMP kinase
MAKKNLRRGLFITFEGPEGCGKSTHSKLVYDYLKKRFSGCIHTREPGGTKLGERIREVLLHSDGIKISNLTELFLFESARSQIVDEIIKPNLAKKRIVICDRFSDATFSYQGYGGGLPIEMIRVLDGIAARGLKPDLTILLDIDTMTGLDRAKAKGKDRMESKAAAYHARVRRGYLKLAKKEPLRIKVIKVVGTIEETQSLVRREVEGVIQRY